MTKRLCALLTALVMVLCAVSALAENADADPVLVTVNGEEIRESNGYLKFWLSYIVSENDITAEEEIAEAQLYAMDYTIEYVVLEQELSKQGVTVSDEEADAQAVEMLKAQWEDAITSIMEDNNVGADASEEDKAAARADAEALLLSDYGLTEDSLIAQYQESEKYYVKLKRLTDQAAEVFGGSGEVTDQEVEDFYNTLIEQEKAAFEGNAPMYEYYTMYLGYESNYMPEGYRGIIHILLKADEELINTWTDLQARLEEQDATSGETGTDAEATPAPETEPVTQEMVDAAKQAILDSVQDKLDEIKAKLEAGTSFEDLILEYGEDPGMQDEATRATGYAVHADSMIWDPAFIEAAMALEKVGDIGEPIIGSNGVHILKYLRDIPGGAAELTDEMKESYRQDLREQKISDAVEQAIQKGRESAEIVWTEAGEAAWKLPEEAAQEANTAE